jgi:hypothetical protein
VLSAMMGRLDDYHSKSGPLIRAPIRNTSLIRRSGIDVALARIKQIGKAVVHGRVFIVAVLEYQLVIDAQGAATTLKAQHIAGTGDKADGPYLAALFEPVKTCRQVGLVRLARLESDFHINGCLPIGRKGQLAGLDEGGERHDLGEDREGIDARITHAKPTGLPDPVLTWVPFAHAFAPVDAGRGDPLLGQDGLGAIDSGVILAVPGLVEHAIESAGMGDQIVQL